MKVHEPGRGRRTAAPSSSDGQQSSRRQSRASRTADGPARRPRSTRRRSRCRLGWPRGTRTAPRRLRPTPHHNFSAQPGSHSSLAGLVLQFYPSERKYLCPMNRLALKTVCRGSRVRCTFAARPTSAPVQMQCSNKPPSHIQVRSSSWPCQRRTSAGQERDHRRHKHVPLRVRDDADVVALRDGHHRVRRAQVDADHCQLLIRKHARASVS